MDVQTRFEWKRDDCTSFFLFYHQLHPLSPLVSPQPLRNWLRKHPQADRLKTVLLPCRLLVSIFFLFAQLIKFRALQKCRSQKRTRVVFAVESNALVTAIKWLVSLSSPSVQRATASPAPPKCASHQRDERETQRFFGFVIYRFILGY